MHITTPASWRSSTGNDPLDEIRALAGTDRMTIPPPLLEALAQDTAPLPRALAPGPGGSAADCTDGDAPLSEADFHWKVGDSLAWYLCANLIHCAADECCRWAVERGYFHTHKHVSTPP